MRSLRRACVGLAFLLAAPAAFAQEVILKNDSFTTGGIAAFQDGFATGEIGAVRLTPTGPFPVQVTRVQFLFGGGVPGPDTITLRIWDDSAGTAAPGAPLFSRTTSSPRPTPPSRRSTCPPPRSWSSGPFRVGIDAPSRGSSRRRPRQRRDPGGPELHPGQRPRLGGLHLLRHRRRLDHPCRRGRRRSAFRGQLRGGRPARLVVGLDRRRRPQRRRGGRPGGHVTPACARS